MEFCPKCKSVLLPKKVNEESYLFCRKCNYKKKKIKRNEYKIVTESHEKAKEIAIIEEERKADREEERRYMQELYGSYAESESEFD